MSAARTDVLDQSQSDHRELVSRDSRDALHAKRFDGIVRAYAKSDVERLRGSFKIDYTIATLGAKRLWELLHTESYVHALGALTGNMAVQQVRAGLKAIYLSGWQVAADANTAGQMYPDQSLYPVDSVPTVVKKINAALLRADQIEHAESSTTGERRRERHWLAPIMADAEAGFGGPLNAYELMRSMIEAGAAGVHFEDQLASEKKCGHMGGKVLIPTAAFIRTLTAARLAAEGNRRQGRLPGRLAAQQEGERNERRNAEDADREMRLSPAIAGDQVFEDRWPHCTRHIVAASAERDCEAASAIEPQRRTGDQRPEHRGASQKADDEPVGEREGREVAGKRGADVADAQADRAKDDGHEDAEAVAELAHEDAAEDEAEHRHGVGQRGAAARYAELDLHGRQCHLHRPHADAADRTDRHRDGKAEPGIAGVELGFRHRRRYSCRPCRSTAIYTRPGCSVQAVAMRWLSATMHR